MIKRIIITAVTLVCLFCLTACKSINYGTITDKVFTPAHTQYQPIVMHFNKRTRHLAHWRRVPDRWQIRVQNDDGSEWWIVSEDYYNKVNIGDYVDRREESN